MATINSINNKLQSLIDYANSITNCSDSDLTTAIESLAEHYLVKPVLAAQNTWYKGSTPKNNITKIYIVDNYTPTGNENESWNADVGNLGTVRCYVNGADLTIAGNGYGRIYANADSSYLFSGANNSLCFKSVTEIIGAELLDTSEVTTFRKAFDQDTSLQSIDVSNWDTGNVTDMYAMFQVCVRLEALDLSRWDVSEVTDFSYFLLSLATNPAFGEMAITTLGDISKWDVSNCGKFHGMFQACANIEKLDLSGWNTSSIVDMDAMFTNMNRLKEIKLGENFKFIDTENDETDCYLPMPDPAYIDGADKYWHTEDGLQYSRSAIPNNTANTYYATRIIKPEDKIIDGTIESITNGRIADVRKYGFYQHELLNSVDLPSVSTINDYGFYKCPNLTAINAEQTTKIGNFAFTGCSSITSAIFPIVEQLGTGAFDGCSALASISFPLLTTIESLTFRQCESLLLADFQSVQSIDTQAFYSSGIETLILRSSTACTLLNSNAFSFTPIASGTGYIYVPSSLVDEYKSADGWSEYANQIRAIEDYPDIVGLVV